MSQRSLRDVSEVPQRCLRGATEMSQMSQRLNVIGHLVQMSQRWPQSPRAISNETRALSSMFRLLV